MDAHQLLTEIERITKQVPELIQAAQEMGLAGADEETGLGDVAGDLTAVWNHAMDAQKGVRAALL